MMSLSHMFERPLDIGDSPVDFFLWIPGGARRDVLAGVTGDIPADFHSVPSWQRIQNFARHWIDASSPVYDVRSVWLEFDVRGRPQEIPVPLIFFTMEGESSPEPAFDLLHPISYTSPRFEPLRRCWGAIPDTIRYRTLGVLYSRITEAIRMILIMNHAEAFAYLEDIGWPGSITGLRQRIEPFLRFHDQVSLHVDVDSTGVLPQMGMEIYSDYDAMYRGRGGDCRPVLDAAVAEGICTPGLRDYLAKWPGEKTVVLPSGESMRVERMFHHIKVVTGPDLTLRAKAYTTAEYEVLT